jgi:acyl-CoA hydrolase
LVLFIVSSFTGPPSWRTLYGKRRPCAGLADPAKVRESEDHGTDLDGTFVPCRRCCAREDLRVREVTIDELRRRFATLAARTQSPRVVVGGNAAVPWPLLTAADAELPAYRLFMLNAPVGIPRRGGVELETPFVGPGMRGAEELSYFPSRLSLVPQLLRTAAVPDAVLVNASHPRDGVVSLGVEVNILPAAIEAARARGALVVAQINAAMPFTYGDSELRLDDIDLAVDATQPLAELPHPSTEDNARTVAERVASLIPDRATLQLGIGAIPGGVLEALSDRSGLRVWTEMFSDGMLALHRVGALDPEAPIVTSFVLGSAELYAWLDGNRRVSMTRTERTNDPAWISRQPAMTSINAALEVDLYGQANASYVGGHIYSGFGGQSDFVVGALHAHDGQALIALQSWHPKADVSTVVPSLASPATSFQQTAVVTEQGIARLWGVSQREQARRLINDAAHPDARDSLATAAHQLGLA